MCNFVRRKRTFESLGAVRAANNISGGHVSVKLKAGCGDLLTSLGKLRAQTKHRGIWVRLRIKRQDIFSCKPCN